MLTHCTANPDSAIIDIVISLILLAYRSRKAFNMSRFGISNKQTKLFVPVYYSTHTYRSHKYGRMVFSLRKYKNFIGFNLSTS